MNESHRNRLNRIVRGELPCGSAESRTLGVMLLAECLSELRAIRELMNTTPAPNEIDATPSPTIDPASLLAGRLSDVRRAITDCGNADVLARCLEIEQSKTRPRSTIVSAIRARIQSLA